MVWRVLTFLLLGAAGPIFAQEEPVETLEGFWQTVNAAGDSDFRFRAELGVLHYDPEWRMIWAEWDGSGTYFDAPADPLPIESGQRVLLEGVASSTSGEIDWAQTSVQPLGDLAPEAPMLLEGEIEDPWRFNVRRVETRGLVCNLTEVGPFHMRFDLVSTERSIEVIVKLAEYAPIPPVEGAFVRIRGVMVISFQAESDEPRFTLWTDGVGELERISWLHDDPRFEIPVTEVEGLGDHFGQWTRITGVVRDQDSGVSLTVRDGTGQVKLLTRQTGPLEPGVRIEAIGIADTEALGLVLRDGFWRRSKADEESAVEEERPPLPMLRLVEDARILNLDEAGLGYPVRFRGLVTASNAEAGSFFSPESQRRDSDITPG